jgi:hypothetical protein
MAAGALGAADAATRMGVRRHPVVLAAILSDFVVRVMEIAVAINRGRHGGLDRPLIRTLASDRGRGLDRAREYAQARHLMLMLDVTVTRYSVLSLTLDQARERYLVLTLSRYFGTALSIARELGDAIAFTLPPRSLSGNDLDLARELVAGLDFVPRPCPLSRPRLGP